MNFLTRFLAIILIILTVGLIALAVFVLYNPYAVIGCTVLMLAAAVAMGARRFFHRD